MSTKPTRVYHGYLLGTYSVPHYNCPLFPAQVERVVTLIGWDSTQFSENHVNGFHVGEVIEQMLLSIEVQLCTCRECKTFRPRMPSSVAMHSFASMLNNICFESMSAARMSLYSIVVIGRILLAISSRILLGLAC